MTTKSKFLWLLFACILAFSASMVLTPAALAGQPPKSEYTYSENSVITDVCSFPVDVVWTQTAVEKLFFDNSGNLTRVGIHYVEQDVYTANGKTLLGEPYTFNMQILFDEYGEITHVYANGIVARVPLPDGSVFLSAGRVDIIKRLGRYVLTPDNGNSGNIAGFCAALLP